MPYSIELNSRQSARTLEQAIRHGSAVLLEPRIWPEDEPIECRVVVADSGADRQYSAQTLVMEFCRAETTGNIGVDPGFRPKGQTSEELDRFDDLVGTYCDVTIELGEQRYLFCSDVMLVEQLKSMGGVRLHLSRPITIQVSQRRRFRRLRVAKSAQVELRWTKNDTSHSAGIKVHAGGVGWLCNLSTNGMACRTEMRVAEQLWIGDELQLSFRLSPDNSERFDLDAVICNKTPAGTEGKTILGLQFLIGADHPSSAAMVELLRKRLMPEYAIPAGSREGAGA